MSESRSVHAKPLRPTKGAAVALHPDLRPGDALRLIARNCIGHFTSNVPGIEGPRPGEFLHQARIALRRLRSALRSVRPPEAEAIRLRKEAKWLAGALGEARDWDVFIDALRPIAQAAAETAEGRDLSRVLAAARRNRVHARKVARETLRSARLDALLADLVRWMDSPCPFNPPEPALREFVAREVGRRHKHLMRLSGALAHGTPQERHATRVAAKRLRYFADYFGPLLDAKAAKRYLRELADLQEALGILNDLANAKRLFDALPGSQAAAVLFRKHSRARERKSLAAALAAIERLGDSPRFWKRRKTRRVTH